MNMDDVEEWLRVFKWKKTQFMAEHYHEMLEQMPQEIQDHLKECIKCRRLSQQTVNNVFELVNRHFKTLFNHVKKNE